VTTTDGARLLAHGVGGRQDLPIPAHYAFIGGSLALVVSFAVLALAWRTSRFRGDESGRPLPRRLAGFVESRITRGALVVGSLLFTAWVTMAALFGTDTLINPTFGVVFVLLWVGLVPAALLFGPVYRLCNPLRWVHRGICRLTRVDHREGLFDYPERLGLWPAAATLLAFVWLELANPAYTTDLTVIVLWFALVGVLLVLGAALFGDVWFARADPFEVYSSLVARLSPFGRRTDGVLVVRNPLENLDGTPPLPGLAAVVAVLFGSTAFDSFKDSSRWLSFAQEHVEHQTLLNTAALVAFCLTVLVTFSAAAVATGGIGHVRRKAMPRMLAHSIVPIVVGYIVAHYLSFYVAVGIQTLEQLGDPLSRGWPLGDWVAHIDKYWIYEQPTALAVVKVVAVITGHVLGAVAAHDRAVRLLPRRHAVVGQLPMLVLMVAYTFTGLWLLFSS
jgi:hypothetical protein